MQAAWVRGQQPDQSCCGLLRGHQLPLLLPGPKHGLKPLGCPAPGLPSLDLHACFHDPRTINQGGHAGRFGGQLPGQMLFRGLGRAVGRDARLGLCAAPEPKNTASPSPLDSKSGRQQRIN